jgi:hypothetical protein
MTHQATPRANLGQPAFAAQSAIGRLHQFNFEGRVMTRQATPTAGPGQPACLQLHKGGGALSQLESTIIPMAQIILGVVIYVNIMFLKIFGRHLRGFLGWGVGGWVGPTQVFVLVL